MSKSLKPSRPNMVIAGRTRAQWEEQYAADLTLWFAETHHAEMRTRDDFANVATKPSFVAFKDRQWILQVDLDAQVRA